MTPTEYLEIEKAQMEIIKAAENKIAEAHDLALQCPPPHNLRPATFSDIVEGAVIWHPREKKHGGDYWTIVTGPPINGGDGWKTYYDANGCRHGIDGAWVEDI